MAYAETSDVAARMGRSLTAEEETQAAAFLEDAEIIIKAKIPDLDDQIEDEVLSESVVVMVEANAVIRLLRNPNGYISETDGDYSYQKSGRSASGYLEILDHEWALLGVSEAMFLVHLKVPTPFELAADHPYNQVDGALWGLNPMFWNDL